MLHKKSEDDLRPSVQTHRAAGTFHLCVKPSNLGKRMYFKDLRPMQNQRRAKISTNFEKELRDSFDIQIP